MEISMAPAVAPANTDRRGLAFGLAFSVSGEVVAIGSEKVTGNHCELDGLSAGSFNIGGSEESSREKRCRHGINDVFLPTSVALSIRYDALTFETRRSLKTLQRSLQSPQASSLHRFTRLFRIRRRQQR
jgi:hypothetical protein